MSVVPESKAAHTHTHLCEAVPQVVSVRVGSTELLQVFDDALSELLVAGQGGVQHQENGCTLDDERHQSHEGTYRRSHYFIAAFSEITFRSFTCCQ